MKVRRNRPKASNFAFKVRSIQKPHRWSRFWSRGVNVRDENLCHLFSPEKCPVIVKRSRILEIVSNLQRNFLALKVRHNSPQLSIFVRSFSAITTYSSPLMDIPTCRWWRWRISPVDEFPQNSWEKCLRPGLFSRSHQQHVGMSTPCSSASFQLAWVLIYNSQFQYPRWRALFPGTFLPVLMFEG